MMIAKVSTSEKVSKKTSKKSRKSLGLDCYQLSRPPCHKPCTFWLTVTYTIKLTFFLQSFHVFLRNSILKVLAETLKESRGKIPFNTQNVFLPIFRRKIWELSLLTDKQLFALDIQFFFIENLFNLKILRWLVEIKT